MAKLISLIFISHIGLRFGRETLFFRHSLVTVGVLSATAVYRDANAYIKARWEVAPSDVENCC